MNLDDSPRHLAQPKERNGNFPRHVVQVKEYVNNAAAGCLVEVIKIWIYLLWRWLNRNFGGKPMKQYRWSDEAYNSKPCAKVPRFLTNEEGGH